jgi:hypothetical protein
MALSSEAPSGILLASAARTATTYSDVQTNNKNYKGILIVYVVSVAGGGTHTPTLQAYDPASNTWVTWLAGTAIAAAATTTWLMYPTGYDISGVTGFTQESQIPMPTVWRLLMTATDANSLTYSVGYQYLV